MMDRVKGWTSGPWYRSRPKGENRHFIMADGFNIAVVRYNRKKSNEAKPNANLIAAAPDLVEALEDLLDYIKNESSNETFTELMHLFSIAERALNKVYGETK